MQFLLHRRLHLLLVGAEAVFDEAREQHRFVRAVPYVVRFSVALGYHLGKGHGGRRVDLALL